MNLIVRYIMISTRYANYYWCSS